jgi:hypothetical protein
VVRARILTYSHTCCFSATGHQRNRGECAALHGVQQAGTLLSLSELPSSVAFVRVEEEVICPAENDPIDPPQSCSMPAWINGSAGKPRG